MTVHGAPFLDEIHVSLGTRKLNTTIGGSGQPMLLLHGYPLDKRLWSQVIPQLSKSYLCIAPNLRGFGNNQEEHFSFSIAELADDCSKLLNQLQVRQPAIVCGLSMGGYVAMEMVRRHCEQVASLVLSNTRANADDTTGAASRRSIAANAIRSGSRLVTEPMLNKLLHPSCIQDQPDIVAFVQSMMYGTHASTVAWAQLAMAERADFREEMRNWDLPVTVVGGSDDPICPKPTAEEMHQCVPASRLVWIDGTAHLSPLEAPKKWCRALEQ